MARITGTYETTVAGGETVQAFLHASLPPCYPPLLIEGQLAVRLAAA
jgi:hypothetical protein